VKLVSGAGVIALRAYSMWANYLGIACLIAPELIYVIFDRDTNPRIWWILGIVLLVMGIIGRLVDQKIDRTKIRSDVIAAFLAVAIPFIGGWEGMRNQAYLDTIASPPVWTVCYGETNGVVKGDYYSTQQCDDMLATQLVTYREKTHRYFTAETIESRLTPERDTSYVDLAYNAGVSAAGKSTATRRLNAGDIAGGCQALTWWNKAGGRVIRGLVNRRSAAYELCIADLVA